MYEQGGCQIYGRGVRTDTLKVQNVLISKINWLLFFPFFLKKKEERDDFHTAHSHSSITYSKFIEQQQFGLKVSNLYTHEGTKKVRICFDSNNIVILVHCSHTLVINNCSR